MDNNYLVHYGVLGMKWGVRKNPQKAFSKAQKKYARIRAKASALKTKADKKRERLYRIPRDPETYSRKLHKISMMEAKASRLTKKGDKWLYEMSNVFADIVIK